MNVERAIRTAVETGDVLMGERETLKAARNGRLKLAIAAQNCPRTMKEQLKQYAELSKLPVHEFAGSSLSLGSTCGRPHLVSMLGILEAGDSDILELARR